MRVFFDSQDIEMGLVTASHIPLKGSTGSSLAESVKITLVGVELRSERHVALVGEAVDLLRQSLFYLFLFSRLLSEGVVLIIPSVDELIELFLKLFISLLA